MKSILFALAASLALAGPAAAQPFPEPQPYPMPAPTPAPRDVPYPGLLKLDVDATDIDRRIFNVHETVPVAQPGPFTLLFPQWVPGGHSPRNSLEKIAGITIRAGGKPIPWKRDPVDVFAFHVDAPAGVTALEVSFQALSPTAGDQGRVVMTDEMLNLQWLSLAMYPAGHYSRQVQIEASVRLPDGWAYGTALEPAGPPASGVVRFKPVNFDVLVDSPMFAGRYYRQVDLDPGAAIPVRLDIFADRPELLEAATADQLERHRELVRQAYKLYGSTHYNHYDFLFALTDRMGGIGLEHHRSSENGVGPNYFLDWAAWPSERDLLPHGKRRS